MTPTLGWGSGSETLASYKGNMNGGNVGTTMSYSLLTFYNLWDGGESGNWSDNTWNTGLANNQSFSAGIDTKFNSSAVMTAVENVSMKSLTIADFSELTLAGEGIVSVSNADLVLGEGATVRLGEEVTLHLGEKQNGTLSNIVGSGTVIWGNTNKASGHGTTINLTDDFTGTLELSGCISTASGQLDLGGTTKIVSKSGVWFWGGNATVVELVFSGGESTISGGTMTVASKTTVENATLDLASGSNDGTGTLRGVVIVGDGGILKMTSGDVTGWNGGENSLHTLKINNGGKLIVNAVQTFGGMNLTLNGGVIEGTSTIDLFAAASANGKLSTIVVGGGKSSENIVESIISTGLYLRQDDTEVSVDQYGELKITGAIGNMRAGGTPGGNHALIKQGAGTLTLSGNNTYSGGTTVSAGTLVAANANALGSGPVSVNGGILELSGDGTTIALKNATVASGAKLEVAYGTAATYESLTLNGGSVLEIKNGGGSASTISGAMTIANASEDAVVIKTGYYGDNSKIQGTITGEGKLTFNSVASNGSNPTDVQAGISGNLAVTVEMNAAQSLKFSGDNSYSGGTTVSAGTLVAANQNALGSGPLKLNGGTFGTSLDTFSVAGAVELGEDTTSTINLSKYTDGAFNTEKVARITIDNEISGAGSLAVVGNIDADDTSNPNDRRQRLTLSGNNSYTGGTTLSGARVEAGSEKAFGEGNLTMNGSVVTIAADSLTIKNLKSEGTTISTIQLASNRESATLNLISTEDTTTFAGSLTSGVNDGSKTLDLVKTGAGTLVLSGSNTLNAVTVSEGALSVGVTSFGSDVTVGQGAELQVVANDGLGEYFSIYVGGNLNLAKDSKLVVDLKDVKAAGETITLNIVSAEAINLNWNEQNAPLATADVPAIEGFVSIMGNEHLSDYVKQTWTLSGDTLSLTLAIPEPSLFGLLAGLGALTLVGTRRRKKA